MRHPVTRFVLPLVFFLGSILSPHLGAQDAETEWDAEGEVGGSLFFGNRSQAVFTTRGEVERAHPRMDTAVEARFNYGRATDDDGQAFVNRRSWRAGTDITLAPDGRFSPFVAGTVEKSLERRSGLRYDTGVGMKAIFHRSDEGRADLSVSLLAEHTIPRRDDEASDGSGAETRARWSSRLRLERELADGRVELTSETRYRPIFGELGNFTLTSRNTLSLELTEQVRLRFTFLDEYDAGAVDRGARTNNDGQIQVTVVAEL